ncbi:MAG: SLBB domain-containing protein, partial [Planctomycetes bacterium]|nr:SLBB domain-containing protein [Planctomycetota bacterium]
FWPAGQNADAALRELESALEGGLGPRTKPAGKPQTKPAGKSGSGPKPGVMLADTGGAPAAGGPAAAAPAAGRKKTTKWIYSAGKWVRLTQDLGPKSRPAKPARPAERKSDDPFGWKSIDKSDLARVIAINLDQLRAGDPRMNIVIRDHDVVQVPTLQVGEFYVMGEVLRPGVYSLTGRKITVKMAVAAAGNMTALAWPENSILIRRVGNRQEQIIPLDLEAIFRGEEPDIYLKPNDVIAVGTDVRSTFFAVLRNAFRMTYGFGFIYDRNFSQGLDVMPDRKRFTRL